MPRSRVYLTELSCACALGRSNVDILANASKGSCAGMVSSADDIPNRTVLFGAVPGDLPVIDDPDFDFRTNRLLLQAVQGFGSALSAFLARYAATRVAVVLGASTTGMDEAQAAVNVWLATGERPAAFHFSQIELGAPAEFLKRHLRLAGPAYTISTACSSSAKAFGAARRLIAAGVVDAAVVGGVDARCRFALNGFHALGALSQGLSRPFADDRDGINLGEGVALFLMEKTPTASAGRRCSVVCAGCGESSDAYHATAPDPTGTGAEVAMRRALAEAGVAADDVAYVNCHGTGTLANDAMERAAIARVFRSPVFRDPVAAAGAPWPAGRPVVESTKAMTGHCLGAAGAVEAAICWLYLTAGRVTGPVLSNSFAFGGSNACVALVPEEVRT